MLLALSKTYLILIVGGAVAVQYVLAIITLVKLMRTGMPLERMIILNLVALFGFYVGPCVVLVISAKYKKAKAAESQEGVENEQLSPPPQQLQQQPDDSDGSLPG